MGKRLVARLEYLWPDQGLAKLQVLIGLVLLFDLFDRCKNLSWLHSNQAAIPVDFYWSAVSYYPIKLFMFPYGVSFLGGLLPYLMAIHGVLIFGILILGWRQQLLWVLTFLHLSLQASQPHVLYGVDRFMICFLMALTVASWSKNLGRFLLASTILTAYTWIAFEKFNWPWLSGGALIQMGKIGLELNSWGVWLFTSSGARQVSPFVPIFELILPWMVVLASPRYAKWSAYSLGLFHLLIVVFFDLFLFGSMMACFWIIWGYSIGQNRQAGPSSVMLVVLFLLMLFLDPLGRSVDRFRLPTRHVSALALQPNWSFFSMNRKETRHVTFRLVGEKSDGSQINILRPDIAINQFVSLEAYPKRWTPPMFHFLSKPPRTEMKPYIEQLLIWACRQVPNVEIVRFEIQRSDGDEALVETKTRAERQCR